VGHGTLFCADEGINPETAAVHRLICACVHVCVYLTVIKRNKFYCIACCVNLGVAPTCEGIIEIHIKTTSNFNKSNNFYIKDEKTEPSTVNSTYTKSQHLLNFNTTGI